MLVAEMLEVMYKYFVPFSKDSSGCLTQEKVPSLYIGKHADKGLTQIRLYAPIDHLSKPVLSDLPASQMSRLILL